LFESALAQDFVFALWNYCTMTREHVVLYVFDLYDLDESGSLEEEECLILFKVKREPGG
jgi:hypothetical protein